MDSRVTLDEPFKGKGKNGAINSLLKNPMLPVLPKTHRAIMDRIKNVETQLRDVVQAQDALLSFSKTTLPSLYESSSMIALSRQNCGGRVYLRWRWRYGSRANFDVLEHLTQFDISTHSALLDIEDARVSINHAYSIAHHEFLRLLEYKDRQGQLRQVRSGKNQFTKKTAKRFSNQQSI